MTEYFIHQGLKLAYSVQGEGAPVLLIHGFASNSRVNWSNTGWVDFLLKAGRRVIAFDHRGHGFSDKPYDPALYDPALMAADARALLDHLDIDKADILGYSMGARVAAYFGLAYLERACSLVLAGIGDGLTEGLGDSAPIAEALLAPSLQDVKTQGGRMFRAFAEQTKSDLQALAACISGTRRKIPKEDLKKLHIPVLIAAGTEDEVAGSVDKLASLIPGAKTLAIVGRDHMRAVGDRQFKEGVLAFWNGLPPCAS